MLKVSSAISLRLDAAIILPSPCASVRRLEHATGGALQSDRRTHASVLLQKLSAHRQDNDGGGCWFRTLPYYLARLCFQRPGCGLARARSNGKKAEALKRRGRSRRDLRRSNPTVAEPLISFFAGRYPGMSQAQKPLFEVRLPFTGDIPLNCGYCDATSGCALAPTGPGAQAKVVSTNEPRNRNRCHGRQWIL